MIAVGIIGINFHLFKGSVVKDALAATANDWQVVIDKEIYVFRNQGQSVCRVVRLNSRPRGQWQDTTC